MKDIKIITINVVIISSSNGYAYAYTLVIIYFVDSCMIFLSTFQAHFHIYEYEALEHNN